MADFFSGFGEIVGNLFDELTGEKSRQAQQQMMNEQMKAYKEQTELTRQSLNEKRNAEQVQKRRIEEKQIRALRRNYSSQGFLGGSGSSQPDMNSKLGG
jgi:hypothetical protein